METKSLVDITCNYLTIFDNCALSSPSNRNSRQGIFHQPKFTRKLSSEIPNKVYTTENVLQEFLDPDFIYGIKTHYGFKEQRAIANRQEITNSFLINNHVLNGAPIKLYLKLRQYFSQFRVEPTDANLFLHAINLLKNNNVALITHDKLLQKLCRINFIQEKYPDKKLAIFERIHSDKYKLVN